MTVTLYEVGGCVRDELLGVKSKDIDYTAVVTNLDSIYVDPYTHLRDWLVDQDFTIFVETPQFLTLRAQFPKVNGVKRTVTADFVLARKDGSYYDGRRPESVEPGTLLDDLKRRDFTVNAIAKDEAGVLIDPFDGVKDLRAGVLRAVGNAEDRIREDALRALRAVRFAVTKALTMDEELADTLRAEWLPPLLAKVVKERRQQELEKAFKYSTLDTFEMLMHLPPDFRDAVFADGLWLKPTLEG